MKIVIALILVLIFLFISLIHFYWGLGGKWRANEAIPTKEETGEKLFTPKTIECFVVAFGLLFFGLIVLSNTSLFNFGLPKWVDKGGLWLITFIFAIRAIGDFKYVGFTKKIKQTTFGKQDSKYYSPLCLMIAILSFMLNF